MKQYRRPLCREDGSKICKERRLELEHFCKQYPEFKERYNRLMGQLYPGGSNNIRVAGSNGINSMVEERAVALESLSRKIDLIEKTCKDADPYLYEYLIKNVTTGTGYQSIDVPCCKEIFFNSADTFWILLDKRKD